MFHTWIFIVKLQEYPQQIKPQSPKEDISTFNPNPIIFFIKESTGRADRTVVPSVTSRGSVAHKTMTSGLRKQSQTSQDE